MRQNHSAAHHLVCMFGVNAETESDLHGLVEFREFYFLEKRDGFIERIRAVLNGRPSLSDVLSCFSTHCVSLSPTAPEDISRPW